MVTVSFNRIQYDFPDVLIERIDQMLMTEQLADEMFRNYFELAMQKPGEPVPFYLFEKQIRAQAEGIVRRLLAAGVYTLTVDDVILECRTNIRALDQLNEWLKQEKYRLKLVSQSELHEYLINVFRKYDSNGKKRSYLARVQSRIWERAINNAEAIKTRRAAEEKQELLQFIDRELLPKARSVFVSIAEKMVGYVIDTCADRHRYAEAEKFQQEIRSDQYLGNLKLTDNVDPILAQAFQLCPYNIDVYMALIDLGRFTAETVETARTLKILPKLVDALSDSLNEANSHLIVSDWIVCLAEALALIEGGDPKEYLREATRNSYMKVRSAYEALDQLSTGNAEDRRLNGQLLINMNEEEIRAAIGEIIAELPPAERLDALRTRYGWDELLRELTEAIGTKAETKEELDRAYAERLFRYAMSKQQALRENERALLRAETRSFAVMIVFLIVPVIIYLVLVFGWTHQTEAYIEKSAQTKLVKLIEIDPQAWDAMALQDDPFDVMDIDYYRTINFLYIVPTMRYNVEADSTGPCWLLDLVVQESIDSCRLNVPWYIMWDGMASIYADYTVVDPHGRELGKETMASGAMKNDPPFNPYINIQKGMAYAAYCIIVVFVWNRKIGKMWYNTPRMRRK